MAESTRRGLYGIHDVQFWNAATGIPYAHLKILGECNMALTPEIAELMGGSLKTSWDVAVQSNPAEVKITAKEYHPEAARILCGASAGSLDEYAADALGDVIEEANVQGATCIDVAAGIATIEVLTGSEANLKEGYYMIKVVAAGTVDLYAYSDVDFKRGADLVYVDDTCKITSTPETIATGADTDLTNLGIKLVGGSGAIAMTPGDTATFYVMRPHSKAWRLKLGESGAEFEKVGVTIVSEKKDVIDVLHMVNCQAAGMSFIFPENDYGTYDITVKPLYDAVLDGYGYFKRTFKEGI
jgi:hypothetical protein